MKKARDQHRPTLDLMEEAVHLLRSTPLHFFAWYLFGTLPFLLGLLFFWTDMSWSAVAFEHRAETSLGVALLFVWMKTCQALFAGKLRARLGRQEPPPVRFRGFVRLALFQALVQPGKLFALPLAALATIPFGWVFAFYESATALGAGRNTREFFARAWRHAGFWPRQNHGVILIYFLLRFIVFLNVALLVYGLPYLLKMLTGVETYLTQSPRSFLNTTSLAVAGALTYVICDPLLKAIYALRCFQGDSLHSGEDLAAEVRALPRLGLVVGLTIAFFGLATVVEAAPAPAPPAITATAMNQAIDETMKQPRFAWRLPREVETQATARHWPFVDAIGRFLKATKHLVGRAFKAMGRWLDQLFHRQAPFPEQPAATGWQDASRAGLVLVLLLVGGLVLALVVQTLRQLQLRQTSAASPRPQLAAKPDLADETLSADRLPEDEWLALAREYLGKGELRFALRAYFFAGLAHLGGREVLVLARHKSNHEYRRELRRKASDQPPLLAAFEQNIATVERVWYGQHEIDLTGLERFTDNLAQIQKC